MSFPFSPWVFPQFDLFAVVFAVIFLGVQIWIKPQNWVYVLPLCTLLLPSSWGGYSVGLFSIALLQWLSDSPRGLEWNRRLTGFVGLFLLSILNRVDFQISSGFYPVALALCILGLSPTVGVITGGIVALALDPSALHADAWAISSGLTSLVLLCSHLTLVQRWVWVLTILTGFSTDQFDRLVWMGALVLGSMRTIQLWDWVVLSLLIIGLPGTEAHKWVLSANESGWIGIIVLLGAHLVIPVFSYEKRETRTLDVVLNSALIVALGYFLTGLEHPDRWTFSMELGPWMGIIPGGALIAFLVHRLKLDHKAAHLLHVCTVWVSGWGKRFRSRMERGFISDLGDSKPRSPYPEARPESVVDEIHLMLAGVAVAIFLIIQFWSGGLV